MVGSTLKRFRDPPVGEKIKNSLILQGKRIRIRDPPVGEKIKNSSREYILQYMQF